MASAMVCAGFWLLAHQLAFPVMLGIRLMLAAGSMMVLGGFWLFVDYISPRSKIRERKNG